MNRNEPEILPLFTAAFIIGIMTADILPSDFVWIYMLISMTFMLCSFLNLFRNRYVWIPLCCAAMACGAFTQSFRREQPLNYAIIAEFTEAKGTIKGNFDGGFRFLKKGGFSFAMNGAHFEFASQSILLPVKLRCHVSSLDLIPLPEQKYLATGTFKVSRDRKSFTFLTDSLKPVTDERLLPVIAAGLRRRIKDALLHVLPERYDALMNGFLLGDTSEISRKDREILHNAGVSHLMAVSGQHIMVFALFLAAILHWFGIPPLSRGIALSVMLVVYGMVTTGSPSVWRALVMYVAALITMHIEADPGPIRPLAGAALFLLLIKPGWLHTIGFQFSFAATAGILIGRVPFENTLKNLRIPPTLSRYLSVSLAANIAVMPLMMHHYGTFSPAAFLANPLIAWLFSIILPLGVILITVWNFWAWGALIIASGLSLVLDAFLFGVDFFGMLPYAIVRTGYMPGSVIALMYAAMLGALWFLMKNSEIVSADSGSDIAETTSSPEGTSASEASMPRRKSASARSGTSETKKGDSIDDYAMLNPLRDQNLASAIDQQLAVFPRRSLKSSGNMEMLTFPLEKMTVNDQNLFHRLEDLSSELLTREPDRLLQAQVFAMSLMGGELLSKITAYLSPSPNPSDLSVKIRVKNRYLAAIIAMDSFFDSPLPGRCTSGTLSFTIGEAQKLHYEGTRMLAQLVTDRNQKMVPSHLEYRMRVYCWVRKLLEIIDLQSSGKL